MTTLLWYVFGAAFFAFQMLNYILVIYLHSEHEDLYKELGEPSFIHFLSNRPRYFSHPYFLFIVGRQYRIKLVSSPGLYKLAQAIFATLIIGILSGLMLAIHYS